VHMGCLLIAYNVFSQKHGTMLTRTSQEGGGERTPKDTHAERPPGRRGRKKRWAEAGERERVDRDA
jgi:hypothetical protein